MLLTIVEIKFYRKHKHKTKLHYSFQLSKSHHCVHVFNMGHYSNMQWWEQTTSDLKFIWSCPGNKCAGNTFYTWMVYFYGCYDHRITELVNKYANALNVSACLFTTIYFRPSESGGWWWAKGGSCIQHSLSETTK